MRKKAIIYSPFIALIVVTAVILVYVNVSTKNLSYQKEIGEYQLELIQSKYNLEKKAFFLEQAARNSVILASTQLAENGGTYNHCELFNGYSVWNPDGKDCMPRNNLSNNLASYTKDNFKALLEGTSISDYKDSFAFSIGKTFAGTSFRPLVISVNDGELSIMPSFIGKNISNTFPYSGFFSVYDESLIISKIRACSGKKSIRECADEAIEEVNKTSSFEWEIDCDKKQTGSMDEKRIVLLCIKSTSDEVLVYHKPNLIREFPVLKFAIYIPFFDVEGMEANEKDGEDKAVILSWKKSNAGHYNIYYSSQIILKGASKKDSSSILIDANNYKEASFDITCVFTEIGKPCMHAQGTGKREDMEPKKLYLARENYYYLMQGLDDKEYSFSLSSDDNKDLLENSIEIRPKDNLAPSKPDKLSYSSGTIAVSAPATNIDGTIRNDKAELYFFLPEGKCENVKLSDGKTLTESRRTREDVASILGSAKGKDFCLAALAHDGHNPVTEEEENGINILKIRPEYSDIIDALFAKLNIVT